MSDPQDPKDGMRWLWTTAVVLAAVFFCYPLILSVPLTDPDEGFHATVAQEMVEKGDWVTPRFLGEPFLDKPVLFTWSQALSLRLFGMSESAVRLPGLLFGLLGMITTGLVARRMFNPKVGLVAAILYATTALPTALAQCAVHDVALIPWVNLSILMFWEADRAGSRKVQAVLTLAIGVLLGLSCLTKGFMGVALVGIAYGCYLLVTRRLTPGACLRGAVALAVGGLVAASWYVCMELRNPGYLYYYIVQRHLLGLATSTQRHGDQPWWYYLPILLGGGLPWIIYLPAGLRDWWERVGGRVPPRQTSLGQRGAMPLLFCWLVACSILLSLAGSKLVTYIWPVFPAMAILAAVVWVRVIDGDLAGPARRWFAANFWTTALTGPLLLPASLLVAQELLGIRFSWLSWLLALAAGFTCWAPLWFWAGRRAEATLCCGTMSIAAQFAVVVALIGPPAAHMHSALDLAQHLNRLGTLPSRVVIVEERVGSLVFYLQRDLRAGLESDQLQAVRASSVPDLPDMQAGTIVAFAGRRAEEASQHMDLNASEYQTVGRYQLYTAPELGTLQQTTAKGQDEGGRERPVRYAAREGLSAPVDSAVQGPF